MNASTARRLAEHAHKGQVDKSGADYIRHPERIARAMKEAGYPDSVVAVAWLHDVVEDTHITLEKLHQAGFSVEIISAVDALTHRKNEPRIDYYERVKVDAMAHAVKHFDIQDNTDPRRLEALDDETRERLELKYEKARMFLGPAPDPEDFA